jgi:hypothetical protein
MNDDELERIWQEPGSRDSSVVIGTSYGLYYRGSIPGSGKTSFPIPQCPDQLCGPPSHLSNGYRKVFPEVKRQRREAQHSPPSRGEMKNGGDTYTLPIRLHA